MNQLRLIQLLESCHRKWGKNIFTLRELVLLSGESQATAAMTLLRAEKKGIVFRVGHLWMNQLNPPSLAKIGFSCRSPSYISFESALYHHGVVSQSPQGCLNLAVRGRSAVVTIPVGTMQFVHLKAPLFFGYDEERMAHAEKAILDLVYIRSKAGLAPLFTETIYWDLLNKKRLKEYARKYQPWVGRAVFENMRGVGVTNQPTPRRRFRFYLS